MKVWTIWDRWANAVTHGAGLIDYAGDWRYDYLQFGDTIVYDGYQWALANGVPDLLPNYRPSIANDFAQGLTKVYCQVRGGRS